MDEPIDVKEIPLPGEEYQSDIIESSQNDEINLFDKTPKIQTKLNNDNAVENNVNNGEDNSQNIDNNTQSSVDILSQVITNQICEIQSNESIEATPDTICQMETEQTQNIEITDATQIPSVTDVVKSVDSLIADTAQMIENVNSEMNEIQKQVESVSIKNQEIIEITKNEIIDETCETKVELKKEEQPQETVSDLQVDNNVSITESNDESFTLILNVSATSDKSNEEIDTNKENQESTPTIEEQLEKMDESTESPTIETLNIEEPNESNVIQEETKESNVIQEEINEINIIQEEINESNVIQEEIKEKNVIQEEIIESNVVQEGTKESNVLHEEPQQPETNIDTLDSNQVEQNGTEMIVDEQPTTVEVVAPETTTDIEEKPQENPVSKQEVVQTETLYIVEELTEPIVVSQNDLVVEKPSKDIISPQKPEKKVIKEEPPSRIPCHMLGRNIDNPQEDLVSNGRTPPKPRLGVKVPYRHLTSQIVSKQDLTDELIERVCKRNPVPDPPIGGDIFFAQKLTQRLASKIVKSNQLKNLNNVSGNIPEVQKKDSSFTDKQDLLAILEGDVDVDLAHEVRNKPKNESEEPPILTPESLITANVHAINTPPVLQPSGRGKKPEPMPTEIEKIIALKQLEAFPRRSGRRKQNLHEEVQKREILIQPESPKPTPVEVQPSVEQPKENKEVKPAVSTPVVKKKIVKTPQKPEEKVTELDDVPILTRKKVTRTYSRKEPILEVPEEFVQIIDAEANTKEDKEKPDEKEKDEKKTKKVKKVMTDKDQTNKTEPTYVSKRARVIKRKVIWDPDETPIRKSMSPTKKVDENTKSPTKKPPAKTVDDKKQEEKPKKAEEKPKKAEEKKVEEKPVKKLMKKTKILRLKKVGKHILLKKKVVPKKKMSVIAKKKLVKGRLTELDKLLMDEGAVNMLYNVREQNKKKPKSQKELLNRAKHVKEVITSSSSQTDTPKALRNKENVVHPKPTLQRKKSRDSIRSSIQSPPPSPSVTYQSRAEASRIIRRHSSSFSSEGSENERRLSIDEKDKNTDKDKQEVKRKKGVPIFIRKAEEKTYKGKRKITNDSQPAEKTPKTEKPADKLTPAEKRKLSSEMSKNFSQQVPVKRTRSSMNSTESKETDKEVSEKPVKTASLKKAAKKTDKFSELVKDQTAEKRVSRQASLASKYKEISVRKIDNLVQIILTSTTTKIKSAVNLQMFAELCEVLNKLSKDETCRVVLISSTDNYFCHGIDFSTLIESNKDRRLSLAQEMAKAVKEFFHTLAHYPKPLVAGVQGPALGLGVTMLPLFDLVLASDKATFATPYGRLGQIPEGAIFLTSPHIRGSVLTSELLFACRKLTASEALQHGLVTRVLWPDKFQEELIPIAQSIAKQSTQCMVATKSLLRQSLLTNLDSILESESKQLVEHWTSAECQQNFKKMLQENEWW